MQLRGTWRLARTCVNAIIISLISTGHERREETEPKALGNMKKDRGPQGNVFLRKTELMAQLGPVWFPQYVFCKLANIGVFAFNMVTLNLNFLNGVPMAKQGLKSQAI